jgi:hypothetical protein
MNGTMSGPRGASAAVERRGRRFDRRLMRSGMHFSALTALGVASLVAAPSAQAQLDPASTVKPMVLILLDTSGSMEYEAGTASTPSAEFISPLCEEPSVLSPAQPMGTYEKSRLLVAKEVLTGTIQDYWCQYDHRDTTPGAEDYLYPIPQVRACSGDTGTGCNPPVQAFDGVFDIFRDTIKFGFMTFDSLDSNDVASPGMWSYGPDATGFIGLNLGVRNAIWGDPNSPNVWDEATNTWLYNDANRTLNNRGQLIPPPVSDDFAPLRTVNRNAQYEVNTTIGFWGTPLAPMLDDARYFLQNDPSVRPFDPGTGTGDPYSNCRPRTVVLITDGRASQGEGEGGYPTTVQAVIDAKNTPPTPVDVYVIGFNLAAADTSVLDQLDPDLGGPATGVYRANTAAELQLALAQVLSLVQPQTQSRTETVVTNATRSTVDLQYQFNAAFQADKFVPTNLNGILEQLVFQCHDECIAVSARGASCARDLVSIHKRLNARINSTRDLKAVVKGEVLPLDATLADIPTDVAEMNDLFGVPITGDLSQVDPGYFDITGHPVLSTATLGSATDLSVQQEYLRQLVKLVRADDNTMRHQRHMGAITHTTPVVQEAPRAGQYPIRSWNKYVDTALTDVGFEYAPKCRPTVLYTGTHDGLIHAFRVDHQLSAAAGCEAVPAQADEDVGQELWAIAPQHLLSNAHSLVGRYHFLMDGQIALRDVLLKRGNPVSADLAVEAAQWRSVLLAGYGAGGRGYIALDVTNPLAGPKVMWEIDHKRRCYGGACYDAGAGADNDYGKLGLTTSRPAFGTVFLSGAEVAVAVMAGGDSPDDASNPEAGRVVYVVDVATGAKLAEFSNSSGNVFDGDGNATSLISAFTGSPTVYSDTPGVVSTRAFVGDAGGRMWRLDMDGTNTNNWKLALFYDPYAVGGPLAAATPDERQPAFGRPAVALANAGGDLAVVYGTGDIDYVSTSATIKSGFFSVQEVEAADGRIVGEERWYHLLAAEEKATGEPLVFDSVAYFTTFVFDPLDACVNGGGRIYGVHFRENAGSADQTVPALDADGDPLTQDLVVYVSTGSAVPYGVQVVERPACSIDILSSGGSSSNSAGGVQRGDLELLVNVARGTGGNANTTPPNVTPSQIGATSLSRTLSTSGEMLQSSAWGYVLY